MSYKFKSIGVIARPDNNINQLGKSELASILHELCVFLKDINVRFLIDQDAAKIFDYSGFPIKSRTEIGEQCDLAIVVGGDGSMLNAARTLSDYKIAVIGIHRGRLGFLTDINPNCFKVELIKILNGDYIKHELSLLHADIIMPDNTIKKRIDAINEIVINSGNITRMIEFEIYINNKFVYQQRSDGLIIATPTGSTAYALSGGGPIVNPELQAITLVPMFAHNLTSRPIVISDNAKIKIVPVISQQNISNFKENFKPGLSGDGQPIELLDNGYIIEVYKSDKTVNLLHPSNYDYYETIRKKLHWGAKLGQ